MCNLEVRFTLKIGHRQPGLSGPNSANNRHPAVDIGSNLDRMVRKIIFQPRSNWRKAGALPRQFG